MHNIVDKIRGMRYSIGLSDECGEIGRGLHGQKPTCL